MTDARTAIHVALTAIMAWLLPPRTRRVLSGWANLLYRWFVQIGWLLEFEPTWFPEFGFAVGAIGWGLCSFLTNDIAVSGSACVLPSTAIVLGVARGWVLLRLWYGPRVVLCAASALLQAWLFFGLAGRYGVVPMMGWILGAILIEMLTAAKFSIPCARELRDDFLAWRHAR